MIDKNKTPQFPKMVVYYYKLSALCFTLAFGVIVGSLAFGGVCMDNASTFIAIVYVFAVVILVMVLISLAMILIGQADDYNIYKEETNRVTIAREFWNHSNLKVTITRTVYCREHSVSTIIADKMTYTEELVNEALINDIATYIPEGQRAYAVGVRKHGANYYWYDGFEPVEVIDNAVVCNGNTGYSFEYYVNGMTYCQYFKSKN